MSRTGAIRRRNPRLFDGSPTEITDSMVNVMIQKLLESASCPDQIKTDAMIIMAYEALCGEGLIGDVVSLTNIKLEDALRSAFTSAVREIAARHLMNG